MTAPAVAVLHAPGTNRDGDALVALERAGGAPSVVPIGRDLDGYPPWWCPAASPTATPSAPGPASPSTWPSPLAAFAAEGRPVLGICNGFQALVRAGLLPGRPVRPVRPSSRVAPTGSAP